jgi:hypothetical protein
VDQLGQAVPQDLARRLALAGRRRNLSDLPVSLSDAFCRLASGGSFAVRQLYSDDDEVLFQAARPILLNGIEDVISRPDLADRAIFVTLTAIAEEQRRPEQELWREFETAAAHSRCPARCGGAWLTRTASRSLRETAANGRFRALGNGLRNSVLASRHILARL